MTQIPKLLGSEVGVREAAPSGAAPLGRRVRNHPIRSTRYGILLSFPRLAMQGDTMSAIETKPQRTEENPSPSSLTPPSPEQIERLRSSVLRSIALQLVEETDLSASGYPRSPYDRHVYFRSRD